MALSYRHQPFAHIATGGDPHPQAHGRVLVDIAPVGAEEEPPLRFREAGEIACGAIAHAVEHAAGIRRRLAGEKLQQSGLARPGFAHHREHLAFVDREGGVAAAEMAPVIFRQPFGNEQREFSHGCCP
jgi:hypothetical protein